MERYIRYQRLETTEIDKLQTFFDNLIKEGWEIIYYNEVEDRTYGFGFKVVVVVGKKQHII